MFALATSEFTCLEVNTLTLHVHGNDRISGGGTDAGLNVGLLRSEVPLLSGSGENDSVQVSNV